MTLQHSESGKISEIRDAIHGFIRFNELEKHLINSPFIQRLRNIRQLALTSLVYPGATHTRFEHSLGVMELAGRIFDNLIDRARAKRDYYDDDILNDDAQIVKWRQTLRIAALFHDVGHLPFSHAAENLLPVNEIWGKKKTSAEKRYDHEYLTKRIIEDWDVAKNIEQKGAAISIKNDEIIKLALGPKKYDEYTEGSTTFTPWEAILSEIITGDYFGADRMDYLLRDAYYTGAPGGEFDHSRLIDSMRILPKGKESESEEEKEQEPKLGLEEGGMLAAESLLVARYFMYSQVYFHPIRKIYDHHLVEYTEEWLKKRFEKGEYPIDDIDLYLTMTDADILADLQKDAHDKKDHSRKEKAKRIVNREHFRIAFKGKDQKASEDESEATFYYKRIKEDATIDQKDITIISKKENPGKPDFPILTKNKDLSNIHNYSGLITTSPAYSLNCIFAKKTVVEQVRESIRKHKEQRSS